MRPLARSVALAGLLATSLGSAGCTLCKPLVGAVTGPAVLFAASNGDIGGCGCDGRAVLVVFAGAAVVGAAAGLVTGIISDVQVLRGVATDPTNNWWDPFAINTGPSSCR